MAILSYPHEIVNLFAYAGAAPAAASGVLSLDDVYGTTIPMREIDQVETAVATAAGTAQVATMALSGTFQVGSTYRIALFGINNANIANQALSASIVATGTTGAIVGAQLIAAFNAKQDLVVASGGATITFTAAELGPSFKVSIWAGGTGTIGAFTITVPRVYPSGTVAQLAALFPNVSPAPAVSAHTVVWRNVRAVDGTNRKVKYVCYYETLSEAQDVLVAVNVLDTTGVTDTQDQAQIIQIP